jgi:hypothetical protein
MTWVVSLALLDFNHSRKKNRRLSFRVIVDDLLSAFLFELLLPNDEKNNSGMETF